MVIRELIEVLEKCGYNIGNIRQCDMYLKIEKEQISIAGYARISTDDPKETSIDNQRNMIYDFVETELNIDSDDIIVYSERMSGTANDRPKYKKLLYEINKNKVNVVIVSRFNRFGRDSDELIKVLYDDFYYNNVLFICIQEQMINSLDNKLIFKKEAINAEQYCRDTSKNVRQGLKAKMRSGSSIASKALYGYVAYEILEKQHKKTIKKRTYIPANDGTEEIVKEIYYRYISGDGYAAIKDKLNTRNVPSPTGGKWNEKTISSILSNPKYCGKMVQGITEKQGYKNSGEDKKIKKKDKNEWIYGDDFEGIITETLFNDAQIEKDRRGRYRKKGEAHLFSGLLTCGECGKALIYKTKDKGYKCSSSQSKGGCSTHFIKENELLDLIKDKLKQYFKLINREVREQCADEIKKLLDIYSMKDSLRDLQREKERIEKKMIKDNDNFQNGILNERSFKLYNETNTLNLLEVENKLRELEHKFENCQIIYKELDEIINQFIQLDDIDNSFLRLFIKKIEIFEYEGIYITWNFKKGLEAEKCA